MITPSYGLTATERVLPRLALDFTTASLDPRVTFTRTGNTATVTNSLGLIAPINADLPRFDFDPITLVCKGLLIEEARTNLFTYSDQFNDASWTKTNSTITTNATISPDGTLNADTLIPNTTSSVAHHISKTVTTTAGVAYAHSIYAKAAGYNRISIWWTNTGAYSTFDLSLGTVLVNSLGTTSTITPAGDGWYRCTSIYTQPTSNGTIVRVYVQEPGTTAPAVWTGAGDGTSGVYIWGAQLEVGAFPTSYIPTVASTVLRNFDIATMTSTNFSDWYNQSEGGFICSCVPSGVVNDRFPNVFAVSDGTNSDSIRMFFTSQFTANSFLIVVGNVNQASLNMGSPTNNTPYTFCSTYKLNNFASAKNGEAVITDTSGSLPTANNRLQIGRDGASSAVSNPFNGTISKFFYYPQQLTNSEVQAFSKG